MKVLAMRLSSKIDQLINLAQSAFIHGRSILDSVASAQEVISSCKHNGWKALFLKLDFAKAFDMVE